MSFMKLKTSSMKKARKSFGDPYDCQKEWPEDCGVQCGDSGLVFSKSGNYQTAFFEAFPKNPGCFLRGEGATIEEAEENCWNKYQKVIVCNHEMERRDRKDGYGYCKHCSYSDMVFEPLTKCCKCGVPTRFHVDYKDKHYCKKHYRVAPKDPIPKGGMFDFSKKRIPRKRKKILKQAVTYKFRKSGYNSKVYMRMDVSLSKKFRCGDKVLTTLFRRQELTLIQDAKRKL
jgi:hypothetical protein